MKFVCQGIQQLMQDTHTHTDAAERIMQSRVAINKLLGLWPKPSASF